jgi:hypothetical protein
VDEDQPFNGKVTGTDKDGDTLTYSWAQARHGTVTIDKDTASTPTRPIRTTTARCIHGDRGRRQGWQDHHHGDGRVTPEKDVDDTATTGYDKSVTIDVLGNDDFEGANVTITQVDGKAITEGGAVALTDGSGSVKLVGGQLEFTPKAGFVGDAKFSYTAQTDGGTPEQANVTVTVAANQLPEPTDPNIDPTSRSSPVRRSPPTGNYRSPWTRTSLSTARSPARTRTAIR